MKADIHSFPHHLLLDYSRRLQRIRRTIAENIGDSSKLDRAADEISAIVGYIAHIDELLRSPIENAQGVAGFRLLGCSGLITMAAYDVAVRIRGRSAVAQAAKNLGHLREGVGQLASALMSGETGFMPVASAEFEARLSQELARILREWKSRKNIKARGAGGCDG